MEPIPFEIAMDGDGGGRLVRVRRGGLDRLYRLASAEQQDWLDFHAALAADFGTRLPHNRLDAPAPHFEAGYEPLLTEPLSPGILYGYGDPAAINADDFYYLYVTSNDAPDAFPILRSADLRTWDHAGYVFREGETPGWAATGMGIADYWAPEVRRVAGRYLLCFTARERDRSLSIGLASAAAPAGPFVPEPEPLLRGGVIDGHIFVAGDGASYLFWKADSNAVWPRLLAEMLSDDPALAERLFERPEDRATAAFAATLWPLLRLAEPMEQFFALQPLIEAAVANYAGLRRTLGAVGAAQALEAMRTPIYAQRLSPDGLRLVGERVEVLSNDIAWEGHLIEGPWVTEQNGLFYLFYAGNDFSTADYGIGVAVAGTPLGPYRKMEEPLLRSTAEWWGPGHPSVAAGLDGQPQLFFHAFSSGRAGYKQFRALLTARLRFSGRDVSLSR